jgi:hypothetical protein
MNNNTHTLVEWLSAKPNNRCYTVRCNKPNKDGPLVFSVELTEFDKKKTPPYIMSEGSGRNVNAAFRHALNAYYMKYGT